MPLSIPGTAAAVTAATSAMPPSYIICIVIIALEVIIITAMVIFLLWKPKEGKYSAQKLARRAPINKKNLAIQGLEPWTFALLARRSNQLSYTALVEKIVFHRCVRT